MSLHRSHCLATASSLALLLLGCALAAQVPAASAIPATAPTQRTAEDLTAPIAARATAADRPGGAAHPAHVTCTNGQLEVRAENSSLNGILRAISGCNGMRISGGVPEQRVFGNYGPAAPATVLATLIDGTGSNMLLRETAAGQPAELVITPRTGGPSPPSPSTYTDPETTAVVTNPQPQPQSQPFTPAPSLQPGPPMPVPTGAMGRQPSNQTPVPAPLTGSAVTSPASIPPPLNNVNGNPNNTSPTAGSFPAAASVPLDSVRTPSTTPPTSGIVDEPNPPPAGSDTAAALSGTPVGTPAATSQASTPGVNNTAVPAAINAQTNPGQPSTDLTPEQIFQQLQRQQQQKQQQQTNPPPQ